MKEMRMRVPASLGIVSGPCASDERAEEVPETVEAPGHHAEIRW